MEKVSGGSVTYECGHSFEIEAEMNNGMKFITAPPRECPACVPEIPDNEGDDD